jgi:hypothetical protein
VRIDHHYDGKGVNEHVFFLFHTLTSSLRQEQWGKISISFVDGVIFMLSFRDSLFKYMPTVKNECSTNTRGIQGTLSSRKQNVRIDRHDRPCAFSPFSFALCLLSPHGVAQY